MTESGLLILCLVLSAFFSGSETAFLSVNRIRLEGFIRRKLFGAQTGRWFLEKPSRFVLTTLVGTNLANIAFSSLITAYLLALGVSSGWSLPVATLTLLIFAEIIPKSLGRDLADSAVLWVSWPLRVFQVLLLPAIRICGGITSLFLSLLGISRSQVQLFFTRRDLELIIREGVKTGALKSRQESLISRVFGLRSLRAREVMTPRTEIVALATSATLEDLRRISLSSGYSKIPVYRDDIDHIIGVCYARDLFEKPETLAQIVRPIAFFPEQKRAAEIFGDLRAARQSMAVIVDEWGGTAGLVTLEDVIEELTGEIEDEYDRGQLRIRELGDGRWVAPGRMEVEELNRRLGLEVPEGEYETLGGYLISYLGRIPKAGETVKLDGVEYKIVRATATRVNTVVIRKAEDEEV